MDVKYAAIGAFVLLASVIAASSILQGPTGMASHGGQCTLIVDDGGQAITLSAEAEGSAFDILRRHFETRHQEYATGAFITAIKTNDWVSSDSGHSWLYFVNNEMPELSADSYYPVSWDTIVFKYMSTEEAMKFF